MAGRRLLGSLALTVAATAGLSAAAWAQHSTESIPEPVPFNARWSGPEPLGMQAWGIDGVDPQHEIEAEIRYTATEASDERFAGSVIYAFNNDHYRSIDLQIHHSAFTVSNEDGSWQERPAAIIGRPDLQPTTRTGVFDGAGSFEGLVAVAEMTWDPTSRAWDVHGYIVEGGFPPLPGEGAVPDLDP